MGGRGFSALVLALAWLAAACSERAGDTPTGPEFRPVPSGCNTSALIDDIKAEFGASSAQAKLANDLKGYGAQTAQATYVGYQLLDAIATKYEIAANQSSTTIASNSAIEILNCINIGSAAIPASFENQLGPAGAFAVRGFQASDSRTVTSHDGTWILEPPALKTWQAITTLATTGLPDSVAHLFLAHGRPPASTTGFSNDDLVANKVFDWATIPDATFLDNASGLGVVVGECTQTSNYLQHNSAASGPSPEVLGFIPPSCYQTFAMREPEPRSFAERIQRFFSPTPAFAALATSTGTGGSKSKLSPFGVIDPDLVNLFAQFNWKKSGYVVGVPIATTLGAAPKYQIQSEAHTPFLQDYVLIWLEAIGNSGLRADVCNNWAYTNANGVAQFPAAFFTKAGGYTTIARTTGTSSKPGVVAGSVVPSVPPGASISSPILNVKNGTLPACPAGAIYHEGDPLPTPPGPNGFAPTP